jgi:putative endonuclease
VTPRPGTHRVRLLLADLDVPPSPRPTRTPGVEGAGRGAPGGGLGRLGEDLAVRHLTRDDRLELVARNWRIRTDEVRGELDVVARDPDDGTLVVCEVKARRDAERFDGALAAVGPVKRQRLRRLTLAFLRELSTPVPRVRLDVIAIDMGREPVLTHVEAAW